MNSTLLPTAINQIDDDLIQNADTYPNKTTRRLRITKWFPIAVAVLLIGSLMILATPLIRHKTPVVTDNQNPTTDNGYDSEMVLFSAYKYVIDDGIYSDYVMGKGIHPKYINQKLEDVTVTAGWLFWNGEEQWKANEHARAELFSINGIPTETAVAIRFLDKLEAEVTGYYYVVINPLADPEPVQKYVIERLPLSSLLDGQYTEE